MSRLERVLFGTLICAALVLGLNSLVAANGWVTSWRAYNSLAMGLSDVHLVDDDSEIDIGLRFVNGSDTTLSIIAIESRVNLNGRYISGGNLRPDDARLSPGASFETQIPAPIYRVEESYLAEQQSSGSLRWRIDGRVLVQVEGGGEPQWVDYVDWLESS